MADANANLRPWQPGESGNPSGRPKRAPITDYIRAQLEQAIPEAIRAELPPVFAEVYGNKATFGQMLAFKMIQSAGEGDMQAMRELLERVEGKIAQKVSGSDGGPVQFVVTRAGNQSGTR